MPRPAHEVFVDFTAGDECSAIVAFCSCGWRQEFIGATTVSELTEAEAEHLLQHERAA